MQSGVPLQPVSQIALIVPGSIAPYVMPSVTPCTTWLSRAQPPVDPPPQSKTESRFHRSYASAGAKHPKHPKYPHSEIANDRPRATRIMFKIYQIIEDENLSWGDAYLLLQAMTISVMQTMKELGEFATIDKSKLN